MKVKEVIGLLSLISCEYHKKFIYFIFIDVEAHTKQNKKNSYRFSGLITDLFAKIKKVIKKAYKNIKGLS